MTKVRRVVARLGSKLVFPALLRPSLLEQYLLASVVVLVVTIGVLGSWIGGRVDRDVLYRTAELTALDVVHPLSPVLQPLEEGASISPEDVRSLDDLVKKLPLAEQIVSVTLWSPDGRILYSPDHRLVGQRLQDAGELAPAIEGHLTAMLSELPEPPDEYERGHWGRLLVVDVPIRARGTGQVVAVAEIYRRPDALDQEIATARSRSWETVVVVVLVPYLLLFGIVKRGSETIEHQRADLRARVAELTVLLNQDVQRRERQYRAAAHASAIHEQALRRIGADLHDGPGQLLALALLRLDAVEQSLGSLESTTRDFAVVKCSIEGALGKIRSISSSLRLPPLGSLTVADVVDRVVRSHAHLTGDRVEPTLHQIPELVPVAVKIALYRALQEALSNATQYAHFVEVEVTVSSEGDGLALVVSDGGPGFDLSEWNQPGRLGLPRMRELAELLGGRFEVESQPGKGTVLRLWWPTGP